MNTPPLEGTRALPSWQATLLHHLPLMGHRNWIVVADAAYPWQVAPGIETITTEAGHLEVLDAVLYAVDDARHVRPIVHLDSELTFLDEGDAPGFADFKAKLGKLLAGREVQSHPHEQVIARLDRAGVAFRVLVFKTVLTLPYTSVFVQLDCGYWDEISERNLRDRHPSA